MAVPKFHELFNPTLQALKNLGGSGNNGEIIDEVAKIINISEEDYQKSHLGKGNQTEFGYRLAWAKTYLRRYGLLTNSSWAIWALTTKGFKSKDVDPQDVILAVRAMDGKGLKKEKQIKDEPLENAEDSGLDQLIIDKLKSLSPEGFERFCQRLLREAGFIEVEVTGKSGDGGIDGVGVIRLNLISFRVYFQCKRYDKSISPAHVRELKGAMDGRAGRGLLITTSTFTRSAEDEARRFGEKQIDLIDGVELARLMREFKLGLKQELSLDEEFYGTYQ